MLPKQHLVKPRWLKKAIRNFSQSEDVHVSDDSEGSNDVYNEISNGHVGQYEQVDLLNHNETYSDDGNYEIVAPRLRRRSLSHGAIDMRNKGINRPKFMKGLKITNKLKDAQFFSPNQKTSVSGQQIPRRSAAVKNHHYPATSSRLPPSPLFIKTTSNSSISTNDKAGLFTYADHESTSPPNRGTNGDVYNVLNFENSPVSKSAVTKPPHSIKEERCNVLYQPVALNGSNSEDELTLWSELNSMKLEQENPLYESSRNGHFDLKVTNFKPAIPQKQPRPSNPALKPLVAKKSHFIKASNEPEAPLLPPKKGKPSREMSCLQNIEEPIFGEINTFSQHKNSTSYSYAHDQSSGDAGFQISEENYYDL